MENDLRDILLIVLGWLFGLLSPAIVAAIRDKRETAAIQKAIHSDLQELQYRLLLMVFRIEGDYGQIDHKFFELAQSVLTGYSGVNSSEKLIETLGPMLNLTANEMKNLSHYVRGRKNPNSGLSLKKFTASLLDSNLAWFPKFDPVLRGHLLEIRTRVAILNEIVDEARYYFQLSFQNGISTVNYEIANNNMINSYNSYAKQAREIIGIIGKVLTKN